MAKEQFLPAFNVTNAHILEDGQAWIVGALVASPRLTDGFDIDADEQVQDTIGQIYSTTDFGENWYHLLGEQRNTLRDVLFLDEQHGWIAGDNGDLFSTEDGGQTWQRLESGTTQRIVDVHFASLEQKWGWLMLRDATLLYTQDGSQWTAQNKQERFSRENSLAINAVAFGNFSEGWAVGEGGDIIHNPDGGTTWARQRTSTGKNLTGVDMQFAPLGWGGWNEWCNPAHCQRWRILEVPRNAYGFRSECSIVHHETKGMGSRTWRHCPLYHRWGFHVDIPSKWYQSDALRYSGTL